MFFTSRRKQLAERMAKEAEMAQNMSLYYTATLNEDRGFLVIEQAASTQGIRQCISDYIQRYVVYLQTIISLF